MKTVGNQNCNTRFKRIRGVSTNKHPLTSGGSLYDVTFVVYKITFQIILRITHVYIFCS